jgi:hypothetical protein
MRQKPPARAGSGSRGFYCTKNTQIFLVFTQQMLEETFFTIVGQQDAPTLAASNHFAL